MFKDYLGKAAKLGRQIAAAIKAGQHDQAWRLLHEKQELYTKHAQQFNFSKLDTLTILTGIQGGFAQILKKEGKHPQALIHVIYMVASDRRRLKKHHNSLRVHFNRCKFKNSTIDDMYAYSERIWSKPDFQDVRRQVSEWGTRR